MNKSQIISPSYITSPIDILTGKNNHTRNIVSVKSIVTTVYKILSGKYGMEFMKKYLEIATHFYGKSTVSPIIYLLIFIKMNITSWFYQWNLTSEIIKFSYKMKILQTTFEIQD